ncbi:MAG: DUF5615 family PIN-like protein [Polyangiaceae bacterium]|nr:DUF5615 family PIN-like protein [Polyangiaceae bacterium]
MLFLLDMNVPPSRCDTLGRMGHEAVHVSRLGLSAATDEAIVHAARDRNAVVITNDLDFTRILAVEGTAHPSLVLFRLGNATPNQLSAMLERHLPSISGPLRRGAIAVIEERSVRVRTLPVGERIDS